MTLRRIFSLSILSAGATLTALAGPIPLGDVAVAVGSSQVKIFSPTGTLLETLSDSSGTSFTTGMVFDGADNLYVTNFSEGNVSKFDSNGILVSSSFMTANNTPESILVNQAGNFLVGGPGGPTILQYSSAGGSATVTYTVAGGNGTGGTDWADLEPNQQTLLYDGEGTEILSYNLATKTQNAVFASGLPGADVFEFRILPSGSLAGDVLAADSSESILLNSAGAVIKTYTLPGNDGSDFALNLDPNGTDFWTADTSGTVWEINIATGHVDEQWNSGSSSTFGLVVNGQLTAGGPPPSGTPEPGTVGLMIAAGIAVFVSSRFRRAA